MLQSLLGRKKYEEAMLDEHSIVGLGVCTITPFVEQLRTAVRACSYIFQPILTNIELSCSYRPSLYHGDVTLISISI